MGQSKSVKRCWGSEICWCGLQNCSKMSNSFWSIDYFGVQNTTVRNMYIGKKKRSTASDLIFSFMPLFSARKWHPFTANILSYEMDLLKNFKRMWPRRNQTNVFKVARKIFISGWKHSTFPPQACISPLMKCTVQWARTAAFLTDGITHTKRLDESIQGPWPREVPYALPFTIPGVNMQQQAQGPVWVFFLRIRTGWLHHSSISPSQECWANLQVLEQIPAFTFFFTGPHHISK